MARRGSKLGTSVLDLDVDDSRFSSGLERNRRKAKSWTDSLNADVKKGLAQGIGIGAGLGVASAVAAGIEGVKQVVVGSIAAAMEWESAFAGVRKTVDASEAEFAELGAGIRQMSKEIPASTTELAGLAEAAGALGIAKDDILEFTRVTAMIGTTTDVSSDQAATSLGQLSNVLGLTAQDYERFGSTLVDLGNKGASTESQILGIASRAGAGSKLISMATDETLAWSSAVANLGIEVEAGGSALQTFFLQSAKSVAAGTEKLEKYAEVAGMTGAEFKRAFEEDASGALEVFLAGLGKLSQGEQLAALSDLGFKDVRVTRMLLGLAGNVDNLTNSLEVSGQAWKENSALAAEAATRYGTTESKLQILGNRVNDLAIEFGDNLLPALVDLATLGVEQLEMFAKEVGDTIGAVQYMTQVVAGHFGEMGDAGNKLADELDEDFGVVNDAIARYMTDTGASFEKAIEAVRLYGTGNTAVVEQAGRDWETYQESIRGSTTAATGAVVEGVEGQEAALLAGEEGIATAADGIEQAISKEAQEARDKAIQAMKDMLTGMSSLFKSDEEVRDAWQGLIDRMDDPYTEAERRADLFSKTTINNIRDAITSGDPSITQDTATMVNNMLAQISLLEPGALARGELVPPALQEGMDSQMSALIRFLEQTNGMILTELTLDEARELGLTGIWEYAQGMLAREEAAKRAAAAVAAAARTALQINTFSSGMDFIGNWAAGIDYNSGTATEAVRRAVGGAVANLPYSEPKDPKSPARGLGKSGEAFIRNIAAGMQDVSPLVEAARNAAAAASPLLSIPSIGSPSMPGLASMASGPGGSAAEGIGSSVSTVEYHLHYNGAEKVFRRPDDFLAELEALARFNDGASGGVN